MKMTHKPKEGLPYQNKKKSVELLKNIFYFIAQNIT